MSREEILKQLADAVINGEEELCTELAQKALDAGISAYDAIMKGCAEGMKVVSDRYENCEIFVPEILVCSSAMYKAMDVLKPHLKVDKADMPGTAVIGVIEGDVHDIGKNLVRMLLDAAGFVVHDLGRDVQLESFIEKAKESEADLIACSTLMTTTMFGMKDLVDMLKDKGVREQFKVMIGGSAVSQEFANKIAADGYAEDAARGVKLAKELIRERVRER